MVEGLVEPELENFRLLDLSSLDLQRVRNFAVIEKLLVLGSEAPVTEAFVVPCYQTSLLDHHFVIDQELPLVG
tara:strand:+ start:505 stop:723 length:219 start_codon:yes stop_codon:yes gene_type:complete